VPCILQLATIFDQGENSMDLKTLLDLIANQGFPIALSILLIFRIDSSRAAGIKYEKFEKVTELLS